MTAPKTCAYSAATIEVNLPATVGLRPGLYEVFFELQSPKGAKVSEVATQLAIDENLQPWIYFDNINGTLEKQPDRIRVFGTALDDYVRRSEETVILLLVRTSSSDKVARFCSREGNAERAPALAIRGKP